MIEIKPDYSKIASSEVFRAFVARKQKFILPAALFFFAFYFTLPILTSFTSVLVRPAIGKISWAWLYAFAQFVMTWLMCGLYTKRAAEFDRQAERVAAEVTR